MAKSIMQSEDVEYPTCYLCERNGNGDPLEEHHIFEGHGLRPLSEKYGLKVKLCSHRCHKYGARAVHQNIEVRRALQAKAQEVFEIHYPDEDFLLIFGKNYL